MNITTIGQNGINDDFKKFGGEASEAPREPSELDRFGHVLTDQQELINQLYSRLRVVSATSPVAAEKESRPDSSSHISSLIDAAVRNNQALVGLIKDLVI